MLRFTTCFVMDLIHLSRGHWGYKQDDALSHPPHIQALEVRLLQAGLKQVIPSLLKPSWCPMVSNAPTDDFYFEVKTCTQNQILLFYCSEAGARYTVPQYDIAVENALAASFTDSFSSTRDI